MLPELGVIFDAGTGIFRARDLIQTDTLDIFLTHIHLDHCIGLTFLYDVLYQKEMQRVTVHLAEEKIEAIEKHLFSESLFPVKPNFDFQPLSDRPVALNDGSQILAIPLDHPGGAADVLRSPCRHDRHTPLTRGLQRRAPHAPLAPGELGEG